MDKEFDQANKRVSTIKKKLEDYLSAKRKELRSNEVTYTTFSKRYRYELEMPEEVGKSLLKSEEYIHTSDAKNKQRF